MKIYPYNPGSQSAKALAEALGIKRIKHEGKDLFLKDVVINWGCSNPSRSMLFRSELLNNFTAVKKASNKLETFKTLDGHVSIPEWTQSQEEALKWLAEGSVVVARTKLNGHSGDGLVLIDADGDNHEIPEAPLYTKYVAKKQEYRIHVFRDEAFFVQRKARKMDVPDEEVNWKVRNLNGGFIFAHQGVDVPDVAKNEAIMAVKLLGLDFGAVDVIWNQKEDKYYILEINCAPGLEPEGTALKKYAEQFRKFL